MLNNHYIQKYLNVIPVLGSQIKKEQHTINHQSSIIRVFISDSLSIILEDFNPHMLQPDGTMIPVGSFANPQTYFPEKIYYIVLEDVDTLRDGFDHYIHYIGKYDGNMNPGVYINHSEPLYGYDADNKKAINGFQGIIIGNCIREQAILSYAGIGCPQFFYSNFLGVKSDAVCHISIIDGFGIPINRTYEENWGIENDDGLHIFSCRFGYQGFNWENTGYSYLNHCLYVSGVILDIDPNTLDLPRDKTYFENLD